MLKELKCSEKEAHSCRQITFAAILLSVSPMAIGRASPLGLGRAMSLEADIKGTTLCGIFPSEMSEQIR